MTTKGQNSVFKEMTNMEKIDLAINKLRVFGSSTYLEDLEEELKEDKDRVLIVADSSKLKTYLTPMVGKLPNIESMSFDGYFVDVAQGLYIRNTADAITEIARRLEQFYIYGCQSGNMLTSEFMDVNKLYRLAELDLSQYKYERLLPVMLRVKFRGSNRRSILKICDYGQNLLPYVIDESKGNMMFSEIEGAISDYKESLEQHAEGTNDTFDED